MYAFFVRKFTTTKLTPGEIHEIGLKEVARIRAEMHHDLVHLGRICEDRAPAWLPVVLEGDGAGERRP
jgi:uncharacterized protein (DUF885 family)